jgi:phospholipase/lecithinase/hemolysin
MREISKKSSIAIAYSLLLFSPLKATASSFSDFVFFGDSITDSGNVFFATGETTEPPFGGLVAERPYASRTFSDEQVWSQYIAEFNGLEAEAFLTPVTSGTNFAFGGATNQSLDEVPSPSLEEQLGFWQQATGNIADPDAFYFVQGGNNDIRIARTFDNSLQANIFLENSVNSIDTVVTNLIDAGAKNIAVINAADIGLTPEAILTNTSDSSTNLSRFYNTSLAQTLDSFQSEDVNLVEVDLFNFIRSITNDPTAFNLPANTITNSSCILPDSVCSDPNDFIFYDGIHPTSQVQLQFANFVEDRINESSTNVPEPSSLIIGFGSIFVLANKKKSFK